MRRKGSILVGVLWCLVLLATLVVSVLHSARLGLTLARHHGDVVQAHYLALAGVEKAKAVVFQQAKDLRRARKSYSPELANSPQQFRDVHLGRGQFSLLNTRPETGETWYGVSDEEARLNLNTASTNELIKIPAMTSDVVAAILDWRDQDSAVTPGGAETEFYANQSPPTLPRNGPFLTLRELLMVRGVTPDLFYGDNPRANRARRVSGNAAGTRASASAGSTTRVGGASGTLPAGGWQSMLSIHSGIKNLNAAGTDRVNVQSADEKALTGVQGITSEIARAIIAHRGRNQIQNLADLLDVRPAAAPGAVGPNGVPLNPGSDGNANAGGPSVISEELFKQIADDLTTEDGQDLPGLVNVNSADLEVLLCLPGVDRTLAQAILNQRQSTGYFAGVGALLTVPGMSRDRFKQILPLITARSDTFRVLAEGVIPGRETRRRIEVVFRVGVEDVSTLSYREDDL
jgi:DNA uptake protein ComE-like DNA-binding protein